MSGLDGVKVKWNEEETQTEIDINYTSYFKPPYSLSSTNVAHVVFITTTRIIEFTWKNERKYTETYNMELAKREIEKRLILAGIIISKKENRKGINVWNLKKSKVEETK